MNDFADEGINDNESNNRNHCKQYTNKHEKLPRAT